MNVLETCRIYFDIGSHTPSPLNAGMNETPSESGTDSAMVALSRGSVNSPMLIAHSIMDPLSLEAPSIRYTNSGLSHVAILYPTNGYNPWTEAKHVAPVLTFKNDPVPIVILTSPFSKQQLPHSEADWSEICENISNALRIDLNESNSVYLTEVPILIGLPNSDSSTYPKS